MAATGSKRKPSKSTNIKVVKKAVKKPIKKKKKTA